MASGPPRSGRADAARCSSPAGLSPLPRRVASGLAGPVAASRRGALGAPGAPGLQRPQPRSGLVLPGPAALARLAPVRGGPTGAFSASWGLHGLSPALSVGHVGLRVVRGAEWGVRARAASRRDGGSLRGAGRKGVAASGLESGSGGSRRVASQAETAPSRGEAARAAVSTREETELVSEYVRDDESDGLSARRVVAEGDARFQAEERERVPFQGEGERGGVLPFPGGVEGRERARERGAGGDASSAGEREASSPPPGSAVLGEREASSSMAGPGVGSLPPSPPPPAGSLASGSAPPLVRPSATPAAVRPYPAWVAALRAACFFTWLYSWSLILLFVMVLVYPWVKRADPQRRTLMHRINALWARISLWPFVRLEIRREAVPRGEEEEEGTGAGGMGRRRGEEEGVAEVEAMSRPPLSASDSTSGASTHAAGLVAKGGAASLPPGPAPIYVANHCSALDILSLLVALPGFKFVARSATFRVPVLGWAMRLTGHVRLHRSDSRSHAKALKTCRELLAVGAPVLFFPEGTRTRDGRLDAFKDGAFVAAAKAKAPIVPVTLSNTGGVMPPRREWLLWPGTVKVTVHAPIQTEGRNPRAVRDQARRVIAQELERMQRERDEQGKEETEATGDEDTVLECKGGGET